MIKAKDFSFSQSGFLNVRNTSLFRLKSRTQNIKCERDILFCFIIWFTRVLNFVSCLEVVHIPIFAYMFTRKFLIASGSKGPMSKRRRTSSRSQEEEFTVTVSGTLK